jgi:phage-related protein
MSDKWARLPLASNYEAVTALLSPQALNAKQLDNVVNFDYIKNKDRRTVRKISWVKGAQKDFRNFPVLAQQKAARTLTQIAEGHTPDTVKPLTGLSSGAWEIVIKERGDAFRVVYALQIGDDIWVIHAFQKKSTSGISTPKHEIDLIKDRIKRLKEALK